MFAIGIENQLISIIVLLAGIVPALGLGWYRGLKAKIALPKIVLATVLLPLFAAFFAHLLCCLVDIEYTLYSYSVGYLFAFWEKGHMMYGGILGVVVALLLIGRKDSAKMLHQYAPSGAWMIMAARIAEGALGQGYGEYWTEPSMFARFPFMVYDAYYEAWAPALFMLEAAIALALFVVLISQKRTWNGDSALLLLGLYASFQIVLESLRRDAFLRWGFVRVEEVISAVLVLVVLLCYGLRFKGKTASKVLCFCLGFGMLVFCLLLEFATEGRIPFLAFLDVNACYAAMATTCVLLAADVLWMRHLCNTQWHSTTQRKERQI